MSTVVIIGILAFIAYELAIFNHYQKEPPHGGKQASPETEVSTKVEDADIIGKSSFNMKAEKERMLQRQEEAKRKEAIARGEMTEDGKEIAQEVKPEDCELEQKKVWKQVPTEQLAAIFEEPEEPEEPQASGMTINDVDLAFNNLGRKDLTEEEARHTVAVFKELEGTEFLDAVERQFTDVGTRIDELIDRISAKQDAEVIIPESFKDFKPSDYL